jgi:hypothetical protein
VPIQLIVDEYNIDLEGAVDTVSVPVDIYPCRERIYGYLKQNNQVVHRICIKSQALYLRFKDFEGLEGVFPTVVLNPKALFRKKFDYDCPTWLTSELVVELKLLDVIDSEKKEDFVEFIIESTDPTILTENNFNLAIEKIENKKVLFKSLLKINDVKERLATRFSISFDVEKHRLISLFDYLLVGENFKLNLNQLKVEQHTDELRKIVSHFKLNLALPPRTINSELLKLPILPLNEDVNKDLVNKWLGICDDINRLIVHEKYAFEDIAKVLISPWPALLNMIDRLIDDNINYLTDDLVFKLESFSSIESEILTAKLNNYRKSVEKIVFPKSPDVNSVLKWVDGYLDKTRKDFSAGNEINSDNAVEFSHWLNNEGPRISRTNAHWLSFSKGVSQSLKENKIVVICMIDALSFIHDDLITDIFSKIDHLTLQKEKLFSPLPTLTEVGKLTVLTGKEMGTHSLPSSEAIKDRYKEYLPSDQALKIFKSWEDTRQSKIENDQKLLVFFENRIDERLHDCPSFDKHRQDVNAVLGQLKVKIESWRKDAIMLNKEIDFYITADHGMTVCEDHETVNIEGVIKDRVIKVDKRPLELPNNCTFIKTKGKESGYIVPFDRRYFSNKRKGRVLSHGGMTPEEVFIPNYKLYSGLKTHYKDVVNIELKEDECKKTNNTWSISLGLSSSIDIDELKVSFKPPFICYKKISSVISGKYTAVTFDFKSSVEQSGLTELGFELSYVLQGEVYKELKSISINFPRKLIEESKASSDFEGMFE